MSLNKSHLKKLITSEYNIGPAEKQINPMIHGIINRYPATASERDALNLETFDLLCCFLLIYAPARKTADTKQVPPSSEKRIDRFLCRSHCYCRRILSIAFAASDNATLGSSLFRKTLSQAAPNSPSASKKYGLFVNSGTIVGWLIMSKNTLFKP